MGGIVSCVSSLMYLSEKLALYLTCTGLICCLVLTITVTLGIGIGLGYNYCFVDMKKDTVEHTVEVCPAWAEHRRVLVEAIVSGGDLSRPDLVQATVRSEGEWEAVTSFCEAVMLAKGVCLQLLIRGHYIYPGSPRWPYKRQGDAMEEPLNDEAAEENALRKPPQPPDVLTAIPDATDPRVKLLEYLRFNNTGNRTGYYPTFHDSESFNGSQTTQHSSVDAATNTEITEGSSETNSTTTSFLKSSSITEDATKITEETDKPTPEPPIVDEEKTKSSPSHRRLKKLVIPISGMDLISLLSKLKAENRNYSLQVVTT